MIGITAMEACEVGVDVSVEVQGASGFDDHTHVHQKTAGSCHVQSTIL